MKEQPMKTARALFLLTLTLPLALSHSLAPVASAQTRTAAAPPRPQAPAAKRETRSTETRLRVPQSEAQVILVRSALMALNHANLTNNYAVLNALGSPGFQSGNGPQKLSQTFAAFRQNRIDLAPVAYVMPRQTAAATLDKGRLRLVGTFPTQPMQVDYDLTYEPVGGQWQLFGVAVNLKAIKP